MSNTAHALLSPSSAERWLSCTPSARLEQQFPDAAGQAAEEGTLAHRLGELLLQVHLKRIKKFQYEQELEKIKQHPLYDLSMFNYCESYRDFVLEQFHDAQAHTKDAQLFLEQKVDLTEFIPEGFGTTDATIIADNTMTVIDLKYGKGVPVSAVENKQEMTYALGSLAAYEHIYDINTVRMIIYQPRIDNISSWEISATDLKAWAESEVRPKAKLAYDGLGEFQPGKHCRFCRARGICKANADHNLEIAKYEFRDGDLLSDEEVADILDRASAFSTWLKSVQDFALNQAVVHGKKWPGWKVVEGRSNRKYTSEIEVAKLLQAQGYAEEQIFEKNVLGITKLEKVIGKTAFNALLSPLIIKPAGKPTLAPLSDKRPEYNSAEAAAIDFSDADV